MYRLRIKPLEWPTAVKEFPDFSVYKANGDFDPFNDANYPRNGEIFQDSLGNLYLHRPGSQYLPEKYVKISGTEHDKLDVKGNNTSYFKHSGISYSSVYRIPDIGDVIVTNGREVHFVPFGGGNGYYSFTLNNSYGEVKYITCTMASVKENETHPHDVPEDYSGPVIIVTTAAYYRIMLTVDTKEKVLKHVSMKRYDNGTNILIPQEWDVISRKTNSNILFNDAVLDTNGSTISKFEIVEADNWLKKVILKNTTKINRDIEYGSGEYANGTYVYRSLGAFVYGTNGKTDFKTYRVLFNVNQQNRYLSCTETISDTSLQDVITNRDIIAKQIGLNSFVILFRVSTSKIGVVLAIGNAGGVDTKYCSIDDIEGDLQAGDKFESIASIEPIYNPNNKDQVDFGIFTIKLVMRRESGSGVTYNIFETSLTNMKDCGGVRMGNHTFNDCPSIRLLLCGSIYEETPNSNRYGTGVGYGPGIFTQCKGWNDPGCVVIAATNSDGRYTYLIDDSYGETTSGRSVTAGLISGLSGIFKNAYIGNLDIAGITTPEITTNLLTVNGNAFIVKDPNSPDGNLTIGGNLSVDGTANLKTTEWNYNDTSGSQAGMQVASTGLIKNYAGEGAPGRGNFFSYLEATNFYVYQIASATSGAVQFKSNSEWYVGSTRKMEITSAGLISNYAGTSAEPNYIKYLKIDNATVADNLAVDSITSKSNNGTVQIKNNTVIKDASNNYKTLGTGTTDIYGDLTINKVGSNNGNLTVKKDASVEGVLSVAGATTLSSLGVTGNTTLTTLTASGLITASNGLTSTIGTTTLGTTTAGDLTASSLTVNDNTTLNGSLTVQGPNISYKTGNTLRIATNEISSEPSHMNYLNVSEKLTAKDTEFSGISSFTSGLTVSGTLSGLGSTALKVTGDISIYQISGTAGGNLSVPKKITCETLKATYIERSTVWIRLSSQADTDAMIANYKKAEKDTYIFYGTGNQQQGQPAKIIVNLCQEESDTILKPRYEGQEITIINGGTQASEPPLNVKYYNSAGGYIITTLDYMASIKLVAINIRSISPSMDFYIWVSSNYLDRRQAAENFLSKVDASSIYRRQDDSYSTSETFSKTEMFSRFMYNPGGQYASSYERGEWMHTTVEVDFASGNANATRSIYVDETIDCVYIKASNPITTTGVNHSVIMTFDDTRAILRAQGSGIKTVVHKFMIYIAPLERTTSSGISEWKIWLEGLNWSKSNDHPDPQKPYQTPAVNPFTIARNAMGLYEVTVFYIPDENFAGDSYTDVQWMFNKII